MRKLRQVAAAFIALSVATPIAMTAMTTSAFAQKTLSQAVGKPLQEAQALAKAGKFREALVKAKEAEAVANKTPYETLIVNDFLTYLYVSLKDYGKAAASAEAAFNTGQAPGGEKGTRLKNIAQLNYQSKNYAKTIAFSQRYLNEVGQNAELANLMMQSYYLQGNYGKALEAAQGQIRAAEKAGKKPPQSSLQIALSSAFRLKDSRSTKETLFKLVEHYPKPDYWRDLIASLKAQPGTGNYRLDVLRLQLAAGQMSARKDFVQMAELSLQAGLPGEAQRALEKGFAAGVLGADATPESQREKRLLATARRDSTADKATIAAQAATAAATPQGDDDINIGAAYESYGENQKALAVLAGGLAKNGLKAPDEARLVLGRVQLNLKLKAEARATFAAIKTDLKYAELARSWSILSRQTP